MKKVLLILLVTSLGIPGLAQFTGARLQAGGLTCAMCSNTIYRALKDLPFVDSIQMDTRKASFRIRFRPGQSPDFDAVKNTVEKAGFWVTRLEVSGRFDHLAIGADHLAQIGSSWFHFVDPADRELNGERTLVLVDPHFLPAREEKRFSRVPGLGCLESGRASACAPHEVIDPATRVYHVSS
ncbi:MAG TPA: heavy metal-associated domain-containing protein [Chitinophagaceae bacterium]|nr:heavy metal-associated domain-containing protein [Chitinophagaceae bacterium]